MTTPLIEAIARAGNWDGPWSAQIAEADRFLTAIAEAGYVILPVEPTMFQLVKLGAPGGTMEERGVDPGDQPLYDIYAAVIAATPDHTYSSKISAAQGDGA